jgi:bifunctional non-homologous end joining protein LigD
VKSAISPREGSPERPAKPPTFVVQKHWARTLHYDFRLEIAGRLVSWAVPKGPSKDPKVRRLAVRTPDHPLDYALFEGRIPEGTYGAGAVMIWDAGTYEPLRPARTPPDRWLARGFLRFILHGVKLQGLWEMVRLRKTAPAKETWLLMKLRDRFAQPGYDPASEPLSAPTGRTAEEIGQSEPFQPAPVDQHPLETWAANCTLDPLELRE